MEETKTEKMESALERCNLCGRRCGADRTAGERGACGAGRIPKVARWLSHMGEEPPLIGTQGSGTVFFTGCSMRCLFCQNFAISQLGEGEEIPITRLAEIMLDLQAMGCHNINLVSPTHYAPQIAFAVEDAKGQGLETPVVYNTHGYDTPEALSWMAGKVDIYLADVKYANDAHGERFSGIPKYTRVNHEALRIMFSQVGHLQEDPESGLATRGLMVRILILPERIEGAKASLLHLKREFSTDLCVSLMAQYVPMHKATQYPPLNRRLEEREYKEVLDFAQELGYTRLWCQEPAAAHVGVPDFSADAPFAF
jgi:putative pyruvate formate lyase activating enzyme